jgi:sugar lactone lactonase YvrE
LFILKKIVIVVFITFSLAFTKETYGQYYIISTIAGSNNYGFSGDGGSADTATLNNPVTTCVDNSGNIYVTDWGNARVRKVNTNGIISTIAGNGIYGYSGDGGPATLASLGGPSGISIDNSGNTYVTDIGNNRIRKITSSGIISTIAGNGTYGYSGDGGMATNASFRDPTGITIDHNGNIFIADVFNNAIRKISATGIISTIAGNGTPGFSGDGDQATLAQLYYPTSIVTDDSGNVFIADEDNNRIRKVNSNGFISTIAGNGINASNGDGGNATAASINFPGAVTTDNNNNIYIADSYGNKIRLINSSGIISTIAGNGIAAYTGDNIVATMAALYNPIGLSIDTTGNLYIGDSFNSRIRKLTKYFRDIVTSSELLNIYPNPSYGLFNINIENSSSNQQIEIYNILGQKLFYTNLNSNGITEINIGTRSAGIYLYKVVTTNGIVLFRGRIAVL